MIEKIQLEFFKSFKEESFNLCDSLVLAGPNNSGKTTLLQSIATWSFAFNEWRKKKGNSPDKKGRTGVPLTRKEFLSLPLQRFNLLWTDSSVALRKDEGGGKGAATPRILKITLQGKSESGESWQHTMEFRYANSELVYAKPTAGSSVPEEGISIVHVPSFSGIETEEKVHAPEYQQWLIGQGKPGDIIRNLMAEVSFKEPDWKNLSRDIEKIFGYRLLKPEYEGRPFILCEYLPGIPKGQGYGGYPRLDIASAGSGFLQTLLILSFFYAKPSTPSTVLLIDEPDAHLHVVLQKQIYEHLQKVAAARHCQVIMATHSEVIIDNTHPEKIISFYGQPHRLTLGTQKDEIREALKRLNSMDMLQSSNKKILYVEDHSDFNILYILAEKLDHPLKKWFSDPYYYPIKGNNPREAKGHFFALKGIHKDMSGVLLLDGDNRNMDDHEISADGLKIIRWKRYEIENYLVHLEPIKRLIESTVPPLLAEIAEKKLQDILPPVVINSPLEDHNYLRITAASKEIFPKTLDGILIGKQEYRKIAEMMRPEEIHPEIKEKLDEITSHLNV